ncbi:MAG: ABC transporter permease subunit, partial [Bacteroidota bacterium]
MLRTILRYEARLLRADNLARIALGLFVVLMLYAGYSGGRYVQEQHAIIDTHQERHTERIASIKEQVVELEAQMVADGASLEAPAAIGLRHPYTIGSAQGQVVALPPGPLAAFAVGQSDLFPPALRVSVGGASSLGYTATLESPFKLLVGHFDLTFFFLFLYPLLIIALLFGLTTSEREGGMLRMLLAQPVRLTTLVTGKLLLRGLLLVACVIIGTALVMGVFA